MRSLQMRSLQPSRIVLLCVAVLLPGCFTQRNPLRKYQTQMNPGQETSDAETVNKPYLALQNSRPSVQPVTQGQIDQQELSNIMAEVQILGTLDRAAQDQLLEDLKKSPPSLWPMLVQSIRASMEFRRRQNEMSVGLLASEPLGTMLRPPQDRHETPRPNSMTFITGPQVQQVTNLSANPPRRLIASSDRSSVIPAAYRLPPTNSESRADAFEPELIRRRTSNDWRVPLAEAIRLLEAQTQDRPYSTQDIDRHVLLRLLYLADSRRTDALRAIHGASAAQQDFWSNQLYGLGIYLDTHGMPNSHQRATRAVVHLREAIDRLGQMSNLVVRHLAFCREVKSYGVFTEFEKAEFTPGQEVVLYAEIENFKSEATPKGFHTSLKRSYEIFDGRGQRVDMRDLTPSEDYCQNQRRDFFVRFLMRIPNQIYPSNTYTLRLTIEDAKSQKIGQGTIQFKVKKR